MFRIRGPIRRLTRRERLPNRPMNRFVVLVYDPAMSQMERFLKKCRFCTQYIRSCNCYLGVPSNWHTCARPYSHSHDDGTPHIPY